jgi:hypothetical protein
MTAEDYMRQALGLFKHDPPDSEFQRGYLEALKVFANEAMGFAWDDPLLWGHSTPAIDMVPKPILTVIQGDKI